MPEYAEQDHQQPFPIAADGFGISSAPEIDYDQESEDEMDEEDEEDDGEYRIGAQEDGMIMMETAGPGGRTVSSRQQISHILEPFSRHLDEHSRISLQSFLPEPSSLAAYHPTLASSPLMNPMTAKIFCHFVYVLGPSMSLFERYPPNPHIAFTPGAAGLHGPQNVWSYTIPILSLQHPPLLHAILALSSLHISKLTQASSQASLLHYHIALRRLGKAIASDRHRGHVATLAATLMLAYYETMAAEHDKWSSHIHGAKQLLKEIDFDRVTRRVKLLDEEEPTGEATATTNNQAAGDLYPAQKQPSMLAMHKMRRQMIADDTGESLKSFLMGGRGRRGITPKPRRSGADRPFTKKELDHLRLQADMFWWYAKMDCYQSLLSGCPLVYVFFLLDPAEERLVLNLWKKIKIKIKLGLPSLGTVSSESPDRHLGNNVWVVRLLLPPAWPSLRVPGPRSEAQARSSEAERRPVDPAGNGRPPPTSPAATPPTPTPTAPTAATPAPATAYAPSIAVRAAPRP